MRVTLIVWGSYFVCNSREASLSRPWQHSMHTRSVQKCKLKRDTTTFKLFIMLGFYYFHSGGQWRRFIFYGFQENDAKFYFNRYLINFSRILNQFFNQVNSTLIKMMNRTILLIILIQYHTWTFQLSSIKYEFICVIRSAECLRCLKNLLFELLDFQRMNVIKWKHLQNIKNPNQ